MTDTDLKKLVEKLRQQGTAAEVGSRLPPNRGGPQVGLIVGEFFYPLWELNEEGNAHLVEMMDFESIRKKRPPDWTFERKT